MGEWKDRPIESVAQFITEQERVTWWLIRQLDDKSYPYTQTEAAHFAYRRAIKNLN